ncbi:hypothetical protein HPP92_000539 [Vanilla planifolia]|uniref:O-fucosyltransferase family protein n=1 Tax=Vanilla planifolia TaxID=51239 RepID=A0A835VIU6_VANPL|nr:hypothetical protein HPP92_000579 [Vanilla planifolia]KAG0500467.1 hypothetical protein HPP92_000539 [Vanilla planifolia]
MTKEGTSFGMSSLTRKTSHSSKSSKALACYKRRACECKQLRVMGFVFGLMGSYFLLDSVMLSAVHRISFRNGYRNRAVELQKNGGSAPELDVEMPHKYMYEHLVNLASATVAKNDPGQSPFAKWKEPYKQASLWKPCADKFRNVVHRVRNINHTGFILVTANGGLNQQRVAVCNAVTIAAMLNASLVLPKFLYSSVWKDESQFGDIYQEDYFLNFLKDDLTIVKELPLHLQSLDLKAIGSQVTDLDIMKESKPNYFTKVILPLLLRNGVVHFLGFGNRLAFDPIPTNLQKLRCKCNFHALKFVPRIQEVGALLVKRIRKYEYMVSELDHQLLGTYMPLKLLTEDNTSRKPLKYLGLHMRFEMDMVAYSMCDFGGGEKERRELEAYREIHFPGLGLRMKENGSSPAELRKLGRCPLTPEEAALMLSALGFQYRTYIYLAGSNIYGGQSRMLPFKRLFPNLISKEELLTPSELDPFRNFSSRLAALDFIACAMADVFAMTDSGSQLSSLVTGFRAYHGRGRAPTLRPNKKRFAKILSENGSLDWGEFEDRTKKMIAENQMVRARRRGRSIYRQPRSPECMCKIPGRRSEEHL